MSKYPKEKQLEDMMREPVPGKRVGIVHLQMVREEQSLYGMGEISGSEEAVEMVKPLLIMSDREIMVVMSMNTRNKPLALEIVAVGGNASCQVGIGNIFKHALLNNAAQVICFHNHPSGDPSPSEEDYQLTKRVQKAGEILGIRLVDHIIIGLIGFYSFQEHGMIADGRWDDTLYK